MKVSQGRRALANMASTNNLKKALTFVRVVWTCFMLAALMDRPGRGDHLEQNFRDMLPVKLDTGSCEQGDCPARCLMASCHGDLRDRVKDGF